jgi:hypothetical protein
MSNGIFGFLWPSIEDSESAKDVANVGAIAAGLYATVTAGVPAYAAFNGGDVASISSVSAYVEAAFFAFLAFGIWRSWRWAAVVALVLYLLEQVLGAIRVGHMVGSIMPVVLTFFLISGIRGTFAFRKYHREISATTNTVA